MKIGLIGAGRMGKTHAGNFAKLPEVRIAAVYDPKPEAAQFIAATYGAEIMSDAAALIARNDLDLVAVCSPTYCHSEAVIPALKAEKNLFCEKPLCRTQADMEVLEPLLRNHKKFFAVGFVRRYQEGTQIVKKLLDSGRIGRPVCGEVRVLFGAFKRLWGDWFADYERSGGVMLDMLAHHADLLNYLVDTPVEVSARALMLDRGTELPRDFVSATARCRDGFICNLECSWLRYGPSGNSITIYGDRGALELHDTDGLTLYTDAGAEKVPLTEKKMENLQDKPAGNMYAQEVAALIDCLRTGRAPAAGVDAAVNAMKFCLAMINSAETGAPAVIA